MFEITNQLCVDDKSLFNPLPISDTLQKNNFFADERRYSH